MWSRMESNRVLSTIFGIPALKTELRKGDGGMSGDGDPGMNIHLSRINRLFFVVLPHLQEVFLPQVVIVCREDPVNGFIWRIVVCGNLPYRMCKYLGFVRTG